MIFCQWTYKSHWSYQLVTADHLQFAKRWTVCT